MNRHKFTRAFLLRFASFFAAWVLPEGIQAAEEAADAAAPPKSAQIAGALQAAPPELRAGARVLAYGNKGRLEPVHVGSNDLICLADDPKRKGFQVACYHRDLEPYMARGRQLRSRGVDGDENRKTRWKEIDEGRLAMPRQPRALYVLTGSAFDAETKKVSDSYLRWVIFTPYATAESTGLSLAPAEIAPWLMFPGTAGAHIVINTPIPKKKDKE